MDRLTYTNDQGFVGIGCRGRAPTVYEIKTAIARLAAYEDAMPLDRVQELAQAEEDGRLVILPCKVVYVPTWDAGEECDLVCPASIDGSGCCDLCDKAEMFIYERLCRQEHIEQIGKTVFLTRKEAEEAVSKMTQ